MTQRSKLILELVRCFRDGELDREAVQDKFASLSGKEIADLPPEVQNAVAVAQRELDAIRWGMCAADQTGEMERIFGDLEAVFHRHGLR